MKTCLITGANGKIGLAAVKKFISEGYFVSAIYNQNSADLFAFKNSLIGDDFYRLNPVKCDLSSASDIDRAFSEIQKDFRHIDVLVNNAGVAKTALLTETDYSDIAELFAVNAVSPILLAKKVLPEMIKRKRGKIINVSSIWGVKGASTEVAYSASKAAVLGFTKSLAKEAGFSGVTVNCVCPGVIDTAMNARLTEADKEDLIQRTPSGRLGTAEEIAELIYYLSSEKADFITGECIIADGGFTL